MIDIVKLANGNVAIYDSTSGDFLRSMSPDVVEIECNEQGEVKVIEDNGNVEYFDPAQVANTQVIPAAAVPFAGDCATLAELLTTDFFFVSGGATDAASITYDNAVSGLTATNVQDAIDELAADNVPFYKNSVWTSFQNSVRVTNSSNFASGVSIGVGFNVHVATRIKSAKLEITAFGGAADGYLTIHRVVNGIITDRVWASGLYAITGTGIYTFAAMNLDLPAGNYAYCTNQSVIEGYRCINLENDNIFGLVPTLGATPYITGKLAGIVGAIPDPYPVGQTNYFGSVPLVIFETEII